MPMLAAHARTHTHTRSITNPVEPCTLGKMASSTVLQVAEEDSAAHTALVENAVLAGWAGRCGTECVTEWNATVGKTLGLEAPLP